VPSTATELEVRNSVGTAAVAKRLANHLASTLAPSTTSPASRTSHRVEQPVDRVVGLVRVVVDDAEPIPMVSGHGIYHPRHFNEVAFMVPGQGVELAGD
jgi:hypothetical protein